MLNGRRSTCDDCGDISEALERRAAEESIG